MFSRNRSTWGIAFLLILATVTYGATMKNMPSDGLWRVITLQFYTAANIGGTASGTLTTDGTKLTSTLPITSAAGLRITASAAPASSSSTPVGELWLASSTACGATDGELYYFKSASTGFVAVEDATAVKCW